jgi:hypothetical protein
MTRDRLAIAADQIRITHNRSATGVEAGAGRGWSAWLAHVRRRRRLATEERLESIERLQRLERRKRESGEYVPDRWPPPRWL